MKTQELAVLYRGAGSGQAQGSVGVKPGFSCAICARPTSLIRFGRPICRKCYKKDIAARKVLALLAMPLIKERKKREKEAQDQIIQEIL